MVSILTNISALTATRHLNVTSQNLARTTERLSTGLRINRGSDNPSGLFTSESLTSTIRGNQAAVGNIQGALALVEMADAGLAGLSSVLQRMRELAVGANNELISANERTALSNEYIALRASITQMINSVTWGGSVVLGGTFNDAQVQAGSVTTALATVDIDNFTATALPGETDLADVASATTAIANIDTALTAINNERAEIGAQISSLEHQKGAVESAIVASTEARSRIRDADMAKEVADLVKFQIQQQAGAAALSAANFSTNFVLSLLQ